MGIFEESRFEWPIGIRGTMPWGRNRPTHGSLDEDGQRYIVTHSDLLGAVCELAVLLGCDLSDV